MPRNFWESSGKEIEKEIESNDADENENRFLEQIFNHGVKRIEFSNRSLS